MEQQILERARKFDQGHLVDHYNGIKDESLKKQFLHQIGNIDFQQSQTLFEHVYVEAKNNKKEHKQEFSPVKNVCSVDDLKKISEDLQKVGMESVSRGEVGVLIMSGGQGTRLGFDHPKGMFDLGLHCNLTLFGFFAHRLIRLMKLAKEQFPHSEWTEKNMIKWYIMTSEMNHEEVVGYFKKNDYFGYNPDSIVFFPQGGLPALSYNGKIVIESEGNVSLAPGGNGAIYSEMKSKGVLEHMAQNKVKYIYLGPVDNVLLKVADPISLGYMIKNEFEIVSHYLRKVKSYQKVGLHVEVDGNVRICEYSEISKELTEERVPGKEDLVYNHGARATMYVTREFVEKITGDKQKVQKINKKYHLAEKKIKYWDADKRETIKPEANNGVKFELFYFDVFEDAEKFGLFETLREEEFSPLKNAKGDDSPAMAKEMLGALHRKWVENAGIKLEGEGNVEIDPIVSYNGQGLKEWILNRHGQGPIKLPLYIE